MKIKQGQVFTIHHRRFGVFKAIALRGFDAAKTEKYPIATLEPIARNKKLYKPWEPIPCHRDNVGRIITY